MSNSYLEAADRCALDQMAIALDQLTKARSLSIQIKEVEFASDLSSQLAQFASDVEAIYLELQNLTNQEKNEASDYASVFLKLDYKSKWFDKAEAGFGTKVQTCSKHKRMPETTFRINKNKLFGLLVLFFFSCSHALHNLVGGCWWFQPHEALLCPPFSSFIANLVCPVWGPAPQHPFYRFQTT